MKTQDKDYKVATQIAKLRKTNLNFGLLYDDFVKGMKDPTTEMWIRERQFGKIIGCLFGLLDGERIDTETFLDLCNYFEEVAW